MGEEDSQEEGDETGVSVAPQPSGETLRTIHAFTDSNFFEQLKKPEQLDWTLFPTCEEVELIVPGAVQREMSRHKSDGNSRRARRAREAVSLFRRILTAEANAVEIRAHAPRVTMRLAGHAPRGVVVHPELNPDHPDEAIIGSVISYKRDHPGLRVLLVTGDTDVAVTCQRVGIEFFLAPDEWQLPPEPDERDKRITRLEGENRLLQQKEPVLNLTWATTAEKAVTELRVEVVEYAPLAPETVDQLMVEAATLFPPPQRPGPGDFLSQAESKMARSLGFGTYVPPTEEQLAEYYEQSHPKWLAELRGWIQRFPHQMSLPSREAVAVALLENSGSSPAMSAIVEFNAHGVLIAPHEGVENKYAPDYLPSPPKRPSGHWKKPQFGIDPFFTPAPSSYRDSLFRTPPLISPRDPNAFYFAQGDTDKPDSIRGYKCEEFRHGSKVRRFELKLTVPLPTPKSNLVLTCTVSASNLRSEVQFVLPVKIAATAGDSAEAVRRRLRELAARDRGIVRPASAP